jgi:hypothetical protein
VKTSLINKPKPGDFAARCRQAYWTPDLAEAMASGIETTVSKWDKKAGCNVFQAQCSLDTTDRTEFERHMRERHGKRKRTGDLTPWSQNIKRGWKGPTLTEDGLPWVDVKGVTETCAGCGLVMEIDNTHASELYVREHTALCTERAA